MRTQVIMVVDHAGDNPLTPQQIIDHMDGDRDVQLPVVYATFIATCSPLPDKGPTYGRNLGKNYNSEGKEWDPFGGGQ